MFMITSQEGVEILGKLCILLFFKLASTVRKYRELLLSL